MPVETFADNNNCEEEGREGGDGKRQHGKTLNDHKKTLDKATTAAISLLQQSAFVKAGALLHGVRATHCKEENRDKQAKEDNEKQRVRMVSALCRKLACKRQWNECCELCYALEW